MKFEIWLFFETLSRKLNVSLKSDKNDGYFTWRPIYIFNQSRSVLLRMRNVSDKNCRENQNNLYVIPIFLKSYLYGIMWKNILLLDRPHIWQYGACAMHDGYLSLQTLRICNTYCFSAATMIARTHSSVTLYVHCLSCFNHPQTSGRMNDLTGITFINEGE
jgi:hypothetical protein